MIRKVMEKCIGHKVWEPCNTDECRLFSSMSSSLRVVLE